MQPSLFAPMKSTIYVRSVEGFTATGEDLLGPPRRVLCYVERRVKNVKTAKGEDRTTTHFIVSPVEITENDRIWLHGRDPLDPTLSKRPFSVAELPDPYVPNKVDHWEVTI